MKITDFLRITGTILGFGVVLGGCSYNATPTRNAESRMNSNQITTHERPPFVDAGELGRTIPVIGPLQEPLGKVIQIEGNIVPHSERNDYWSANVAENLFAVKNVEGKKASAQIELRFADGRKLPEAKNFKFQGYQAGGFVNVPREAEELSGEIRQSNGWHFEVFFMVVEPHDLPEPATSPAP